MKQEVIATIQSAIKENDTHLQRLTRSKKLLCEFFPLTAETFSDLTELEIEHIDQFVYRFSKLQDSMGTRLLPSIYTWLEDDNRPIPFLNVLNRLEKLRLIADVGKWQFFRNLRNNLAHDYPESLDQTVETLNLLHMEIGSLESMYKDIRDYWLKRRS